MVSKKLYEKEVQTLKISEECKDRLMFLYDCYLGKMSCDEMKNVIQSVLQEIFTNEYIKEIMIPHSFLDTAVGNVLFTLRYKNNEKIYTTKDLIQLTGYSKQYIHQQIRDGAIMCKKDNNGRYYFHESDVMNYLKEKGITE